jgi:hypothetical protein
MRIRSERRVGTKVSHTPTPWWRRLESRDRATHDRRQRSRRTSVQRNMANYQAFLSFLSKGYLDAPQLKLLELNFS